MFDNGCMYVLTLPSQTQDLGKQRFVDSHWNSVELSQWKNGDGLSGMVPFVFELFDPAEIDGLGLSTILPVNPCWVQLSSSDPSKQSFSPSHFQTLAIQTPSLHRNQSSGLQSGFTKGIFVPIIKRVQRKNEYLPGSMAEVKDKMEDDMWAEKKFNFLFSVLKSKYQCWVMRGCTMNGLRSESMICAENLRTAVDEKMTTNENWSLISTVVQTIQPEPAPCPLRSPSSPSIIFEYWKIIEILEVKTENAIR